MSQTAFLLTATMLLAASLLLWRQQQQEVRPHAARNAVSTGNFYSQNSDADDAPDANATPTTNTQSGSSSASHTATATPTDPARSGLATYPDLPLKSLPKQAISPRFVVEHRSALKGQTVLVRGRAVVAGGGEGMNNQSPEQSGSAPPARAVSLPRIFLATTTDDDRDKHYDLMILLTNEEAARYRIGQTVEIRGIVEASKVAVHMRKLK